MYNYSFDRLGIDAVYLAFDVPQSDLKAAVEAMRTLHVKGFNVTMPDKVAVLEYLDEITPAAQLIGACNVVVPDKDGCLVGYNTDSIGFSDNLKAGGVELAGRKLVLLGMGGAGTAVAVQAAIDGAAELAIFNRKDESFPNGEKLVGRLRKAFPACNITYQDLADSEALTAAVKSADVAINATRAGMKPLDEVTLIDSSLLRPSLVVADTVYNPRETRLIKEAKAAGCKAFGGIGMLLWQGAATFRLFTGCEFPREEVDKEFFA